jgi:tetratricopeptide (TPR) repeat protein
MKQVTTGISPREILEKVAKAREMVGNETKTREIIDESLGVLHDTVVNLYLEKVHLFQLVMMTERDKGKSDKNKIKKAINDWKRALKETEQYVKLFKLKRWQSRINRYWGRWCDAIGKHIKAIEYYKKSIKSAKLDPEYTDNGVPRWLEIEGFLASSTIYTGRVKTGWEMSKKIYKKFDSGEAAELKNKDYSTWAIWKSGIPIRIGQAMRNNKLLINLIDLREYKTWLDEAEKLLYPPPEVKVWVDFNYRKNEIEAIRREMKI